MIRTPGTRLASLTAASLLVALPALAQRPRSGAHARCDRVGTTAISFGRTGGNIRPAGTRIAPDGAVQLLGVRDTGASTPTTVPVAELRRVARRAWSGPFVRLPTAPSRPTRNPDVAREYIELRSACGTKHVEYQSGTGAPEFRRLLARLDSLAGVR